MKQITMPRAFGAGEMTVGVSEHRSMPTLWVSFDFHATEHEHGSYLSAENARALAVALFNYAAVIDPVQELAAPTPEAPAL